MPPASDLSARLSASAVQTYEICPLQFKLDREWRIPGEVPAAMQYGGTMHRVLRAYYDSVQQGRPMTEESLLDLFRADLADAKLPDAYQHDLYLQQGIEQLKEFLALCRRGEVPEVLHTEEFFEVKVGGDHGRRTNRSDRQASRRPRGHYRLQDRQAALAGGRRREPAALHLCPRRPREVGIPRRPSGFLQPE